MTLKKKGERNLKLAEILDSQDFLELSQFPKEHLCSVIINRLYYGVYLIAKGMLVDKGICKSDDRIPHSGKDCIWGKLIDKNCFNEINLAYQLRSIRNHADYQEDDINEIGRAKEIALELHNILKEIK
ncbi:MAG: hypothetical protein K2N69_05700 [Helicobacter sp.]|nr:hypothetical protein [Helicobacter sp.]